MENLAEFGFIQTNSRKFSQIQENLHIFGQIRAYSNKFSQNQINSIKFGYIFENSCKCDQIRIYSPKVNSSKFHHIRIHLDKSEKIRRNFGNSVKFVCIRINSKKFGKILLNLDRFSKIGEYSGLIRVYQRKFGHVSANSSMFGLIGKFREKLGIFVQNVVNSKKLEQYHINSRKCGYVQTNLDEFKKNQGDLINQCKFDKIWAYPINLMKTGNVHVNPGNADKFGNSNEFGKTWAFPGKSRKPLKFQTNPGKSRQILKLPTSSDSTSYARLNGHSSIYPAWRWLCFVQYHSATRTKKPMNRSYRSVRVGNKKPINTLAIGKRWRQNADYRLVVTKMLTYPGKFS
ncbi:hypothetical protein V1477_008151 [Vespula maculifrons]|uniref:Uncharacterized protein n=1 Tax=Vespula maculifrons TaxID=7453 RepID=A0ABD2CC74_VESMC